MSDRISQKMFIWSGGNKFKLNKPETTKNVNPDLQEAARQREEIRKSQEAWEQERAEQGEAIKKLRKGLAGLF